MDYRTLCFLLWNKQEIISIFERIFISGILITVFSVSIQALLGGKKGRLIKISFTISLILIIFAALFFCVSWIIAQKSIAVPNLLGKSWDEAQRELNKAGISAVIEYRVEGEETVLCRILADKTVEGTIPTAQKVSSHLPAYGQAMRISGGEMVLFVTKEPSHDNDTHDNIAKYLDVISKDNYVKYEWKNFAAFSYPQSLFTVSDSTNKGCPLYYAEKCIYLEGMEEGLYAWIAISSRPEKASIGQIMDEYEQHYRKYLGKSHLVKESIENMVIITGYRPHEVGYVLVSVEDSCIKTLYISFPYLGIVEEKDFTEEYLSRYGDYENYSNLLTEEYRVKSYMVNVMYSLCSFGYSSAEPEPYEMYKITWSLPSQKDMQ